MVERTPKILIVDDDPRLRDLLRRYLGENGFNVLVSENGEAMKRRWVREHFAVLIRPHRTGGNVNIRIKFLEGNAQTAAFQQTPQ